MKKLIVFVAMILISFGIKAIAGNDNDCYLKTGDTFYVGTDLKMGPIHTKIIFADGSFVKVNNRDITAYRHHNKAFMKMPVICDNTDTVCMAMMQYIKYTSGYSVFRYCCSMEEDRLSFAKKNYFFVYKDGKFYRRIDEDQTEALKAFGIKVI